VEKREEMNTLILHGKKLALPLREKNNARCPHICQFLWEAFADILLIPPPPPK